MLLGLRFLAGKRNLWWVSFVIPTYIVYHILLQLSRAFLQKYVDFLVVFQFFKTVRHNVAVMECLV